MNVFCIRLFSRCLWVCPLKKKILLEPLQPVRWFKFQKVGEKGTGSAPLPGAASRGHRQHPVSRQHSLRPLIYSAMATAARRRLMRDFKRMQTDPPEGVNGAPLDNDIMKWHAVIFGCASAMPSAAAGRLWLERRKNQR